MGATDMARGPLMLRISRGWDTVDSTATVVLVLAMVVMAMAVLDTATERGLPMLRPSLRPMPGWATVVLALVMEVMAMVDSTDTERGLLMLRPSPRPMPGTDMVAFMAMVMERGPLMLSLRLMPGMDMVAFTAMDSQFMVATDMDCGKKYQIPRLII